MSDESHEFFLNRPTRVVDPNIYLVSFLGRWYGRRELSQLEIMSQEL